MLELHDEIAVEERLSRPTTGACESLAAWPGDVMILGAGGKMGPTFARMVRRAFEQNHDTRRVYAVSRFSDSSVEQRLQLQGVTPLRCDLTDRTAVAQLPDAPLVFFMTGQKFGTVERPELTWAMNTLVPAIVAERYAGSRIVAFSTGCVYPWVTAPGPGAAETHPLDAPGEYAQTCVGRERIFTYFSNRNQTPVTLFRLNYAIDLRYGVLLDVAQKVYRGEPVDVTTGWANVIWQGDANARAIQCLGLAASPPTVLNVTGREVVSIRELAQRFAILLDRDLQIMGVEAPTAWLSDATRSYELFGPPEVTLEEMIQATAAWVRSNGRSLGKPTHFEVRSGQF